MVARQTLPPDLTPFAGFPTRDNCDPTNPREAYLWVRFPHLMFPGIYLQLISERLFDLFGPPGEPVETPRIPRRLFRGFPTRDNCDPTNPREAYLWGLVALPFQRGAPMVVAVDKLQDMSEQLWRSCGPPDPGWTPRLSYQPPQPTDPDVFTSAGKWVPL